MIAFTQGLLLSIDPKTLRTFFDPSETSEADSSSGSSPIPTPTGELPSQAPSRPSGTRLRVTSDAGRQRPTSISSLQSLHAEADMEPSPNDGVFQASPTQFSLRVGGKIHVFELSLCGGDAFGNDRVSPPHCCLLSSSITDAVSYQSRLVTIEHLLKGNLLSLNSWKMMI